MIDRKEIELLIRAQLQGKGNIAQVTKAIGDLERQIDAQAAAAKRGENSIDELKGSLEELKQLQQQLTQRAEMIGFFQKLQKSVGTTEERVNRASAAFEKYSASLKGQGEVTEKEAARLAKLSKSYETAQASLAKQRATLSDLQKTLAEAGVDVQNLAAAENQLRDAAANLGVVLNRGQQALTGYARDVREARQADAEAAKTLQQFTAAEERATKARLDRARAEEEFNARASARKAQGVSDARAFDEQARINQRTAEAAEFVKRWAAQLDELEKSNAFRKQADDAELATRQYSSLAHAATNLSPKIVSIRDAVDAIINPSKTARVTLAGVEQGVESLTKTIQEIKGPVKDANALYKELGESQKALAGQAGLIDNFRRQMEALRATRAELSKARTDVANYAAEVRKGGDSGASFTKALADAQAKARSAADAMRAQLASTREARLEMRAAGIETQNLASAEQRLLSATQATRQGVLSLTDAVEKYGTASQRAGKGGGMFADEGRTTLSLLQRIRGQVLALTAAYVGLQGAASLAGDAIDATVQREGIKNQLAISVGNDRQAIDEDYAYIKGQAERIGVEFQTAAQGYAKFAASAKLAGRSRQEIRYITETFLEVGRVANLSKEDLDGVLRALTQVVSKGKIQAEELRGQLGDRLFGAFQIAAKALQDQFPDLDKAMEKGLVTSEQLIKIAEQYRKTVAGQLPAAMNGLGAAQARMNNAVQDFKLAVADAGFADSYLAAIQKLTEFFRSTEGQDFAKAVSAGFSALADALVFVLKHLDELKVAFSILLGLWASNVLQRQVADITSASKAILGMTGEVTKLQKAFFALQAFIVGWNIGSYLYDKFAEVRIAGAYLVASFDAAWTMIKYGAQILAETIPTYFQENFAKTLNFLTFFARKTLGILQSVAEATGATDMAANIGKTIDALTFGYQNGVNSRVAQLKKQLADDLASIKKIFDDTVSYERGAKKSVTGAAPGAQPTPSPGVTGGRGKPEPSEAEIKKRQSEIEAITRALETLQAKIDRTQTDSLAKQLEAIDEQYRALARRIQKLGGDEAVKFMEQLATATEQLKVQTTRKFNDKLLQEQESLQSKIEQLEAAAGRKNKSDLDARLAAITASYAATYRDIAAVRATLIENNRDTAIADEMQRRAQLAEQEQRYLETQKFYKDELARREQEINDVLSQRASLIKTINDQREAGLIDQQTADEQINATIEKLQPQIESLALSGAEFANSIRGAFDPVRIDEFIAKMQLAERSAGGIDTRFKQMAKTIDDALVAGAVTAFDKVGVALGEAAAGTKSWSDTVVSVREAFKQFAADFLRMIAQMILKQIVLNALQAYSRSQGGGAGAAVAAIVAHDGGVVGSGHGRTRNVSPAWFANAPRYHDGGVPGMAANEYAAVLEEGEEVLKKDSPRNILNGGAAANGMAVQKGKGDRPVKFVLVDDRAKVAEAMASAEGEDVIIQTIRRNAPTVRQFIKG